MGRKSTKENKSVWQTTREDLGLTREKAGELIPGFSPERIEKIENGRTQIQPEDVMLMAEYYKTPSLRNYYCVNECPIGQVHALRTESKELAQIAVETLNSLNKLSRSRDRLLEIVEDGEVQADEYADFAEIKSTLDRIALSVSNLQLWVDEQIAAGNNRVGICMISGQINSPLQSQTADHLLQVLILWALSQYIEPYKIVLLTQTIYNPDQSFESFGWFQTPHSSQINKAGIKGNRVNPGSQCPDSVCLDCIMNDPARCIFPDQAQKILFDIFRYADDPVKTRITMKCLPDRPERMAQFF